MGAFEEKESTAKTALPADLPNAKTAASEKPDGAIYRSDNGKRYRLRHPKWVEVVTRDKKKSAAGKK